MTTHHTMHHNGPLDVVTIGEAMAMFIARETGDLAAAETFVKRAAGAELNVATGLARLGLKVGWVSRIGDDAFGRFICQQLEKEGIDHARVTVDKRYPTGFQLKSKVDDGSDPLVEYFRKGSAASHLSVDDFDADYFGSARHLHLSGVAAALSESSLELLKHTAKEMRGRGKTISFDPNLRPVLWRSEEEMRKQLNLLAEYADWVLPGEKEGLILTGYRQPEAIADFYLDKGVKAVVIKTGCDGAWYKTAQGEQGQVEAIKVDNVVDTVGAGDGFAVGVISALLEGQSLPQAIRRGNKIGAMAIQVIGDSEGLPTRQQLGDV
ncbi:2-dehydro-3-deoxygluconokinase [Pantoea agglomerans]|uniref:sugar kinase n=1 Tax=Enterobacter agglomerans TaxID=549 RepID=UPI000C076821|nr:sugar kinase [Pantoea agglomerans]PHP95210.1 2-dehydro-3-deoxygluconokinase [Pantoea agglomerans]